MIKTIDNFLTTEECKEYIEYINSRKEKNMFNNMILNFNHKERNPEIANKLYERFLKMCDITDMNVTGCNTLVYSAKYNPGQSFGLHTDTGLYFDKINKICTTYTVLIYLNDDFEEGQTVFYKDNEVINIIPETGKLLTFDISLLHEGKEVKNGIKYWIGFELIGKF